jgi:hypothetical protein
MRHLLPGLALLLLPGTPAFAQTVPAKAVPAKAPATGCAGLSAAYLGFSKDLAANNAAGLADNSAPRATLRAMEDANTLARARITLDLMRDNRCTMPKSVPDAVTFLLPALTCATDRLKARGTESPASCDRSTWQPAGTKTD